MQERCFYCPEKGFYCQEPSVPLIQGRWQVFVDSQKKYLNPEKMARCVKRTEILAQKKSLINAGGL